jgi:mannose/fructose/N-acetylgalactosamine-specific phosphotransferase system component IIC
MTDLSGSSAILLVLWGIIVGLDLVSVPQAMLARPVVAGAVAGWLAGDVEAGLRVGVLFELFALDVLPVGAVRYPDYGPATVAATALAADSPWQFALGVSAALGLAEPVAHLDRSTGLGLTLVALGCALSAAIGGAIRSAGRGPRLRWLGAGALVGLLAAALR